VPGYMGSPQPTVNTEPSLLAARSRPELVAGLAASVLADHGDCFIIGGYRALQPLLVMPSMRSLAITDVEPVMVILLLPGRHLASGGWRAGPQRPRSLLELIHAPVSGASAALPPAARGSFAVGRRNVVATTSAQFH
jgi:hypothetical protein